jgi:hypothetical protein
MSSALEDFGFKFQKLGILKILIFILCNIQFMMVISAIFPFLGFLGFAKLLCKLYSATNK